MAQTDIDVANKTINIGEEVAKAKKGIENITGINNFKGFNVKQDVVGMANDDAVKGYITYITKYVEDVKSVLDGMNTDVDINLAFKNQTLENDIRTFLDESKKLLQRYVEALNKERTNILSAQSAWKSVLSTAGGNFSKDASSISGLATNIGDIG
ncbi:hypothetical protein J5491_01260 [Candidatus Saccharibacteria bacterium]|nr:hypothetical protein [Candidatus Saccharibacteria bacterium]